MSLYPENKNLYIVTAKTKDIGLIIKKIGSISKDRINIKRKDYVNRTYSNNNLVKANKDNIIIVNIEWTIVL